MVCRGLPRCLEFASCARHIRRCLRQLRRRVRASAVLDADDAGGGGRAQAGRKQGWVLLEQDARVADDDNWQHLRQDGWLRHRGHGMEHHARPHEGGERRLCAEVGHSRRPRAADAFGLHLYGGQVRLGQDGLDQHNAHNIRRQQVRPAALHDEELRLQVHRGRAWRGEQDGHRDRHRVHPPVQGRRLCGHGRDATADPGLDGSILRRSRLGTHELGVHVGVDNEHDGEGRVERDDERDYSPLGAARKGRCCWCRSRQTT